MFTLQSVHRKKLGVQTCNCINVKEKRNIFFLTLFRIAPLHPPPPRFHNVQNDGPDKFLKQNCATSFAPPTSQISQCNKSQAVFAFKTAPIYVFFFPCEISGAYGVVGAVFLVEFVGLNAGAIFLVELV